MASSAAEVRLERIPWHPSPDGGPLGRNLHHDPQSWNHRVTRRASRIRSVRHRRLVPPYDQGDVGDCVPNAGKGVLSTRPFAHQFTSQRIIRERDYPALTRMDDIPGNYPPDDTGSDGLSFAKYAVSKGWCDPHYEHAMGIDDTVDVLMRTAVMAGTWWKTGMDQPDNDGLVVVAGSNRGGHEYVLDEYRMRGTVPDFTEDLIGCTNSWGYWGLRGRFYVRVHDFAQLLDEDGDVTVLHPVAA